jgi:hypothetical protein
VTPDRVDEAFDEIVTASERMTPEQIRSLESRLHNLYEFVSFKRKANDADDEGVKRQYAETSEMYREFLTVK